MKKHTLSLLLALTLLLSACGGQAGGGSLPAESASSQGAEPSAPAEPSPTVPSLRELLKRRLWLFLLPVELVVFAALALWRLGNVPNYTDEGLYYEVWGALLADR